MNNELLTSSLDELTSLVTSWGFPKFRARQLYDWLHKHHSSSFAEMSNLPAALRSKLTEQYPEQAISIANRQVSRDGTRKYILKLHDGALVETVGLPTYRENGEIDRLTACVSSQVGCAMACSFCATGKEGWSRNLSAAEIVGQIAAIQEDFGERVSNVVVMGQGEPFLNYDAVLQALKTINNKSDFNIGARHITISTCGILDGIQQLSHESEQFTLAISLHSAIQAKRDALMPRVANQPLSLLKEALISYQQRTGRRVSFEYLLIQGLNDGAEDFEALVRFCRGLQCHINILSVNAIAGSPYQPVALEVLKEWVTALEGQGINASIRTSRGNDIAGACGQLKNAL